MPQSPAATPDFIPAEPDFIPAGGEVPVQKKTPSRAGGAGGSWEPETGYERLNRRLEEAAKPYEQTFEREVRAAGSAAAGVVKAPLDVASAPFRHTKVTPEEQKYGLRQDVGPVGRFGQEIERQMFVPMGEAAGWWKQQLSDPKLRASLIDRVIGVLPEGVGTGAGVALGGKALEAAIPTAAKATSEVYSPYGVKTRGIQGIEDAVARHGNAAVDEAPIRDVMSEIFDMGRHGHTVPDVVKKIQTLFDGMDKAKQEPAPGGGVIEGQPEGLSFRDLRKMRTALDAKIDWGAEGKTTQMERLVTKLRNAMDKEEIKGVYRSGGATEASKYVKAKKNYSRAMKLEASGQKIGAAVGGAAGMVAGAELGKPIGHPWIAASAGASAGGTLGYKVGRAAMKGLTEAGLPKETMTAAQQAATELRAERASSVQAAREFGKGGPKGESDVDMILRRANVPEDVQAKVREVIRKNEEMHLRARAPKGDPDAPAAEVFQRAKAEYEKKYGPSEKAAEMKTAQDNALKKMDEVNREKMRKTSSGGEAPRHNDAIAQAKKELGPNADIRKVLQRADEIERAGRKPKPD